MFTDCSAKYDYYFIIELSKYFLFLLNTDILKRPNLRISWLNCNVIVNDHIANAEVGAYPNGYQVNWALLVLLRLRMLLKIPCYVQRKPRRYCSLLRVLIKEPLRSNPHDREDSGVCKTRLKLPTKR